MGELEKCLKSLKNGKTPGLDKILNECFRHLPGNWKLYLLLLFTKILETEEVPADWSRVVLTMLHKKGDKTNPRNYRAIALINCISKVFTMLLRERLTTWTNNLSILPECQAGFRMGRGCMHNIFIFQSALQLRVRLEKGQAEALIVDFERAFDSVDQDILWSKLLSLGVSAKIIRILRNLYGNATAQVKQRNSLSEQVSITEGVLQDETLSPLLFILLLADIEDFFRSNNCEGLNIDERVDVILLLYTDDLVPFGKNQADLKRKISLLQTYCDANGLKINIQKTKVMRFNKSGNLQAAKKQRYCLGDDHLEVVGSSTYLGSTFSSSTAGLATTKSAISKRKAAIAAVLPILGKSRSDSWATKKKIFDSIVSSTLLYGAHLWGLRYHHQLKTVQVAFFKRLFLLPKCTQGYSLRLELGFAPLLLKIFQQAWAWIIKMLEMSTDRLPRLCFGRLHKLSLESGCDRRFNWAVQFFDILDSSGHGDLWRNLDMVLWKKHAAQVFNDLRNKLWVDDPQKYRASNFCQSPSPESHA